MAFDVSRYRVLVESVADGLIVYDDRGDIQLINHHALALFGITLAQSEGRQPFDPTTSAVTIDGDPFPMDNLPVSTTLRTGEPSEMVVGIDRPNWPRTWMSVRSAPIEGGGVVATLRDASDVKEVHDLDRGVLELATNAVEIPVGHLSELMDQSLAIIGRATGADRVVYVSINHDEGRCEATLDWSRHRAVLPRVPGGVPIDTMARLLGRLTRRERIVVEGPESIPSDATQVPQGFLTLWELSAVIAVPIFDDRRLVGFVVIGWTDPRIIATRTIDFAFVVAGLLSSQHARERADAELLRLNESLDGRVRRGSSELAREQDRVQALIDAIPDAMFELDADALFVQIHTPEGSYFASQMQDLLGQSVYAVVPPDAGEAVTKAIARIRETGELEIVEYTTMIEGVATSFECRLVPRSDGGLLALVRDITGQAAQARILREQSAKMVQTNHDLERAVRAKDDFLASISHELRTPLAAILGLTELLLDAATGPANEQQQSALKTIAASGAHLLALINDLLDLGRLRDEPVTGLGEVASGDAGRLVVEMIRPSAEKRGLRVEFTDGSDGMRIWADERRLRQILLNLLDNAVKFTNPGGSVGLHLSVPDEATVAFAVWDTGDGIDAADHRRIFEPLTQLDSSLARRQAGSGLGLALVDRLVTMHHGRIEVESQLGQGSRFVVYLPQPGNESNSLP